MCEVQRCNIANGRGDNYFCDHHRFNWRRYCKLTMIDEKMISEDDEINHLAYFTARIEDEI